MGEEGLKRQQAIFCGERRSQPRAVISLDNLQGLTQLARTLVPTIWRPEATATGLVVQEMNHC